MQPKFKLKQLKGLTIQTEDQPEVFANRAKQFTTTTKHTIKPSIIINYYY
jgi:hypothetical protein